MHTNGRVAVSIALLCIGGALTVNLAAQERLVPAVIDWHGSFTPSPLPKPGITKFL